MGFAALARLGVLLLATSSASASAATLTTLYRLQGGNGGAHPLDGLLPDSAGNLYGYTSLGGKNDQGIIFRYTPTTGMFTNLYSEPNVLGTLTVQAVDAAGNCYGLSNTDQRTIFKLSPSGKYRTLYTFDDSRTILSVLILEPDLSLVVGTDASDVNVPYGLLIRYRPNGNVETLLKRRSFQPAGLYEDAQGNIFGTDLDRKGSVFELSAQGVFATLYKFRGWPMDGWEPYGIGPGPAGVLLGTTPFGGHGLKHRVPDKGRGTIFGVSMQGGEVLERSLKADMGTEPSGPLYPDGKGGYIGLSPFGSKGAPYGAIFQLTAQGHFRTIYKFTGGADGLRPNGRLAPDGHGGYYGSTYGRTGRNRDRGTIFKLTL